jgi:hypothetical protein
MKIKILKEGEVVKGPFSAKKLSSPVGNEQERIHRFIANSIELYPNKKLDAILHPVRQLFPHITPHDLWIIADEAYREVHPSNSPKYYGKLSVYKREKNE